VTTIETVSQLLRRAPGESLCDTCLAFCCSTTFSDMEQITAQLRDRHAGFRFGTSVSMSCRHTTATTVYSFKCAHCSRAIKRDGLGLTLGGDHFHNQCWQRLLSHERIRISRTLSRESRRLIERTRAQACAAGGLMIRQSGWCSSRRAPESIDRVHLGWQGSATPLAARHPAQSITQRLAAVCLVAAIVWWIL
jgi:hypothetical protein